MRPLFVHAYEFAQAYKWRVRELKGKELSEQLELSVFNERDCPTILYIIYTKFTALNCSYSLFNSRFNF